MTLKAFHNDASIKQKYLDRLKAYMEADFLTGASWEGGKGSAVGCTLEDYAPSRYPIELRIPEWIAYVEDRLFESVSEERRRTWPLEFLSAIKPGAGR
jgi:hypothetical protein